jgi:NADH pyrophosphatase NudC (nudix superfamily)
MFRVIHLRLRYYLGRFCAALGFCLHCGSRLNFTRSGRAICPDCGHRY